MASTNTNTTLMVNVDAIKQASTEWESAFKGSGLSDIDVESTYASLVGEGVGTSYIPSLKKALAKVESSVLATIKTLSTLATTQESTDNRWKNNNGSGAGSYSNTGSGSSSGSSSGASSGAGSSSGESGSFGSSDTDATAAADSLTDIFSNDDLKVNQELVDKFNELDTDTFGDIMTSLGSIADEQLLSYLVDPNEATKLKKYLLEEVNLPDDLKKIVSEMDENELQLTLVSILTDESNISDTTKNIIYNYTEELSKKTNLDINELSKFFFYSVDDFSKIVDSAMKSDSMQEILLKMYEGNDVTSSTLGDYFNITGENAELASAVGDNSDLSIAFVRSSIDEICKKNNIDYETLLTDPSKASLLKDELASISKGLSYFKAVDGLGTEASDLLFKSFILKNTDDSTTKSTIGTTTNANTVNSTSTSTSTVDTTTSTGTNTNTNTNAGSTSSTSTNSNSSSKSSAPTGRPVQDQEQAQRDFQERQTTETSTQSNKTNKDAPMARPVQNQDQAQQDLFGGQQNEGKPALPGLEI